MNTFLKKFLPVVFLLFWMGLIFYLSNQPGLASHSPYDWYLRKAAHITEFFVLTVLAYTSARQNFRKVKQKPLLLGVVIFALFYAMSDEWHQSWVHDRHASPIDVGIDLIGIAGATLVIIYWRPLWLSLSGKGKK